MNSYQACNMSRRFRRVSFQRVKYFLPLRAIQVHEKDGLTNPRRRPEQAHTLPRQCSHQVTDRLGKSRCDGALVMLPSHLDRDIWLADVIVERAQSEAKAAEDEIMRRRYRGLLHGTPFALKDTIDVAGTARSRMPIRSRSISPRGATPATKRAISAVSRVWRLW